ncbi:MAG: DNA alkylation repair protein [Acholeplasmatales bacterium]|nr:DNA alkylation repair protein [Acholeplasmatales bacterium]
MENLKKRLYPNGIGNPEYRNMVGIDHLIKSSRVSIPNIKKACKEAILDDSFDISNIPYDDLVEYQICYFIIGLSKIKTFNEQLEFIYNNAHIAKSWMSVDLCNQYLKKPNIKEYKKYFLKLIGLKGVYERRFGYVIGLKMARDKEACDLFLSNIVDDERYYVLMAEAWLIAELGIYHFDRVKDFLLTSNLSIALKRKAISKMIDSYRISDLNKNVLKEIRSRL